ncbi:endonuclease MutS2 [Salisaeta longa]|uniref:endonuclease MutS2 n=1 Tax=Salisaeta longa TaxID=503170 RepID=UPI0003B47256|nr:Smr/MutS family protein [Salisaeta longa]
MKTYPAGLEEKLGFDVLRQRLLARAKSDLGRERIEKMAPARTMSFLEDELTRVAELQDAFRYDAAVPLHHVHDLRPILKRAAPEQAYVDPEELHQVRLVLRTLRDLQRYFGDRASDYPQLAHAVARVDPLDDVRAHIRSILTDEGRLRDDASPELQHIRRQIQQREADLRAALDRELRKAVGQGYATEEQPTLRAGRMVIPIRAEAKRKVEGFVHDTSATGQTVYIEPAACLSLNNEVRELRSDERREIERILREATGRLRAARAAMDDNLKALAQFDLLQAKAGLANRLEAVVPQLNTTGRIDLHEARNPVLQLHFAEAHEGNGRDQVVPLTLSLGDDFNTLVITGPNAGGKTVAMKTVGLLSLMLAYGLPVPVAPHSTLPLFGRLMVDIGDEQSIEDDLSTFSSHVGNLKHMLQHADEQALVLIDEAGTGTDPDEGGALAQAVLEELTARGTRTLATTHHGTLKVYAHEAEGVENGSMAFDQATLEPTYQYQEGIPGSSYAFDIASRMGLPASLLDRARALAGEQKTAMEDLITTFEERTQALERELAEARKTRRAAEKEQQRYEDKWRAVQKEREDYRQQALEEAERIVKNANARIEQTIREIKEAEAEKAATQKARAALEDFKEDLQDEAEQAADAREPADDTPTASPSEAPSDARSSSPAQPSPAPQTAPAAVAGPIAAGDRVVLDDGDTELEVERVEDDEAVVIMGQMHMRVDLERLTKVGGPKTNETPRSGGYTDDMMRALEASPSIDVRGERAEQGRLRVQHFIDDAIAADLDSVEILHGKGTGALRAAIHEMLTRRPDIASFEIAPIEQGGSGVTIVRLT